MKEAPIYLDHHATTPCDPRVVDAMLPYFDRVYGNASSTSHSFGRAAKQAVERARGQVASLLGAHPKEIVFTSGATESANLAIKGLAAAYPEKRHLVTTTIEHRAVLDPIATLAAAGMTVSHVRVGETGVVDPEAVMAAITEDTLCVAVMAANNEIGTIQPIAEIGAACRQRGVFFLCDAAQAVGKIPFDVIADSVDLACVSAHKLYGPKGVGALYVRRRPPLRLRAQIEGGGQERQLRSGTVNVPGVVGFGAACDLASAEREEEAARLAALRDRLARGLASRLPQTRVNGALDRRLPHSLSMSFAWVQARRLLETLGDIALSSGSACSTEELRPSHVLSAIGLPEHLAYSTIRFGLGRFTTPQEIEGAIQRVGDAVERLRAGTPGWARQQAQRQSLE